MDLLKFPDRQRRFSEYPLGVQFLTVLVIGAVCGTVLAVPALLWALVSRILH